jgi:uncharacterized membrane protein
MKNITITITREDVKKSVTFFKFWAILFILLIIFSVITQNILSNFIYYIVGLFLSLVPWHLNQKSLKMKGNIISKNVTDINSVKNSLLYFKITFIFWLIFVGLIFIILIISRPEMVIGTFFFFVFILILIYKRIKLFSNYLRKRNIK